MEMVSSIQISGGEDNIYGQIRMVVGGRLNLQSNHTEMTVLV